MGKAEGTLRQSNAEHRADIERQETLLGRHFASVCGLANWSLAIIDKVELSTNLFAKFPSAGEGPYKGLFLENLLRHYVVLFC